LLRRRFLRPGRNDLGPAGRWRGLGLGKRGSLWRRLRIDPIRRGFDGWASYDILLGDCALRYRGRRPRRPSGFVRSRRPACVAADPDSMLELAAPA